MRPIASIALLLSLVGTTRADEYMPIVQWGRELNEIAARYGRGATQAQTALNRKELLAAVSAYGDRKVQASSQVRDVKWKDGIAEISTEAWLPPSPPRGPRSALTFSWTSPIELRMDEKTAASIAPGTPFELKGTFVFHSGKWGAVGRTQGTQQAFTLSHKTFPGLPIGTYLSPDCAVSLGGKDFPSRWLASDGTK